MGEADKGYQLKMETVKNHEAMATHTILPGARVKVESKHGKGFAWCSIIEQEVDVERRPQNEEPHHESRMGLFHSMGPFAVYYAQHSSRQVYEAGTRLYAFLKPGDHTVMRIPHPRSVAKK